MLPCKLKLNSKIAMISSLSGCDIKGNSANYHYLLLFVLPCCTEAPKQKWGFTVLGAV